MSFPNSINYVAILIFYEITIISGKESGPVRSLEGNVILQFNFNEIYFTTELLF